jgi:hypothetical protein
VSFVRLTVVEPALFEWVVPEKAAPTQSPTKCEMRYVIRFLNTKCDRPAEIHIRRRVRTSRQVISTCFFT